MSCCGNFSNANGEFDNEGDFRRGGGSSLNFEGVEDMVYEDFFMDGDEEDYENFLTKRARARRKLRRKLRKGGMSKKEAKAAAKETIPKQKLGDLLKHAIKGTTSPETEALIASAQSGGSVVPAPAPAGETGGTTPPAPPTSCAEGEEINEDGVCAPVKAGLMGGKKLPMFLMIGAVVAVGGYFAWKKFGR